MAIIDSKEGAFGPMLHLLIFRLEDIQNDTKSILIVIADEPLMGVCGVALDETYPAAGDSGLLDRRYLGVDGLI
jgi:hypothetical protein